MKIKSWDKLSSSFWLFFSIVLCIESYRLGLGSYHNPGPGFLPFWTGFVFAVFSLLLLILTYRTGKELNGESVFEKIKWSSVILVFSSMLIYALVLETLGFLISTLLFMAVLLAIIARKKWYIVGIIAVTTALATYAVFQLWLKSQLPKGIFGI